MKVGLLSKVSQRPIGFAAVLRFNDCSQAKLQQVACRQKVAGEQGIQFKTIGKVAYVGLRRHGGANPLILLAISREAIGCPLAGRRKIEFTV